MISLQIPFLSTLITLILSINFALCINNTFRWKQTQSQNTTSLWKQSQYPSCIDTIGRLHIVDISTHSVQIIKLNQFNFNNKTDILYINQKWETIPKQINLKTQRNTKKTGQLYILSNTINNSPSLIIYDCNNMQFISSQTYQNTPILSNNCIDKDIKCEYIGHSCLASTNTHIYLIGGQSKIISDTTNLSIKTFRQSTKTLNTMQIYNIIKNIWSYGMPIPKNGIESAACSSDLSQTNIFVFGGHNNLISSTKIYKYNIPSDSWTLLPIELNTAIYNAQAIINPLLNEIYIFTKINTYKFNVQTTQFTKISMNKNTYISNQIYNGFLLNIGKNTIKYKYISKSNIKKRGSSRILTQAYIRPTPFPTPFPTPYPTPYPTPNPNAIIPYPTSLTLGKQRMTMDIVYISIAVVVLFIAVCVFIAMRLMRIRKSEQKDEKDENRKTKVMTTSDCEGSDDGDELHEEDVAIKYDDDSDEDDIITDRSRTGIPGIDDDIITDRSRTGLHLHEDIDTDKTSYEDDIDTGRSRTGKLK